MATLAPPTVLVGEQQQLSALPVALWVAEQQQQADIGKGRKVPDCMLGDAGGDHLLLDHLSEETHAPLVTTGSSPSFTSTNSLSPAHSLSESLRASIPAKAPCRPVAVLRG